MKHFIRITAGLMAACIAALSLAASPAVQASAAGIPVLVGYRGDINNDMVIDRSDVQLLTSYLLGDNSEISADESAHLTDADLDNSKSLNAIDLTLLKRIALHIEPPIPIYEDNPNGDELIPAPISVVNPTMPCVGEARVLMVAVNFPDAQHPFSADEIQKMCFGPEDPQSLYYPQESISAFYSRASYGRLNLTGKVYTYTAQYEINEYMKTDQRLADSRTRDDLLDEVLEALDDVIDYKDYDLDGNGILDSVVIALPKEAIGRDANKDGTEDWVPCSGTYYGSANHDGVKPAKMCIGARDLRSIAKFNKTWIHELGHAMGLPDYYRVITNNPNDQEGLRGNAGWEMMDDADGDFSSFSKLMYGWFKGNEVQIYNGGTQTYELKTLQDAPNCVLIPRGEFNGFYSEYFIVEFNTPTVNNSAQIIGDNRISLFRHGGVRVLHCNAELYEGNSSMLLKWRINSKYYDRSNKKQRVLRLISYNNGFFNDGKVITNETTDFAWYDENGDRTVDPGITITVSDFDENTGCKITIAPAS